jgi:YtcA family
MKTNRIVVRFVASGSFLLLVLLLFIASRFFSYHSLTVDIFGSYFPAWMVCILSGITLTVIAHWIVQLCSLKPYLGPAPLIYSCLMIVFTFATWILFYQN